MTKLLKAGRNRAAATTLAATAALVGLIAATTSANAWERSRRTVGPNGGVWTFNGKGNCANGSCNSQQRWTGPNGGTVNREGSTTCAGGVCNGSSRWTGPNGRQVETQRQFRRY